MSRFSGPGTAAGLIVVAQQSAVGPWAAAGLVVLGVLAGAWLGRQLWLSFRQADQFVGRREFEAALALLRTELDDKLGTIDGRLEKLDAYLHEASHALVGAIGTVTNKIETLLLLEQQRHGDESK